MPIEIGLLAGAAIAVAYVVVNHHRRSRIIGFEPGWIGARLGDRSRINIAATIAKNAWLGDRVVVEANTRVPENVRVESDSLMDTTFG